MANRDRASNQLLEYKNNRKNEPDRLTNSHGRPVGDKNNSLTVGPRGPILLEDITLIDELAHFDRERIPERVVHAKGAGAFGYFEVTHDITQYTKATVFEKIGKRTPMAVRFSTVGGESGSADTARDPRGFALKMYSEDGNWDLVGNNTPIFFIRDPIFFPNFIHTQKRNPVTHLKDPDMFWDFITLRPESTHQVLILFSDRGTPQGYRHMHGFGSHTFKLVNASGEMNYCKFHYKTDQGIKNFTRQEADNMTRDDPDFAIRDLYNAIAVGKYPSYTMSLQIMTPSEAERWRFNPFDVTKVWPHADFPLHPVGKIVLDRNPNNYFTDVEQIAFAPSNMIPGIEASPDKMLQGRLFSYPDTHRHRLGPNYTQIPVNCPYRSKAHNYQRDGPMVVDENQNGAPNYHPNSFSGPLGNPNKYDEAKYKVAAQDVARHESGNEDNFTQAGIFYRDVLTSEEKEHLVDNIASNLCNAQQFIREKAIKQFQNVDRDLGNRVSERLISYANEIATGNLRSEITKF